MLASLIILLVILIIASVMISSFGEGVSIILQAIIGVFIVIVVVLLILYVLGLIGDDGRLIKR